MGGRGRAGSPLDSMDWLNEHTWSAQLWKKQPCPEWECSRSSSSGGSLCRKTWWWGVSRWQSPTATNLWLLAGDKRSRGRAAVGTEDAASKSAEALPSAESWPPLIARGRSWWLRQARRWDGWRLALGSTAWLCPLHVDVPGRRSCVWAAQCHRCAAKLCGSAPHWALNDLWLGLLSGCCLRRKNGQPIGYKEAQFHRVGGCCQLARACCQRDHTCCPLAQGRGGALAAGVQPGQGRYLCVCVWERQAPRGGRRRSGGSRGNRGGPGVGSSAERVGDRRRIRGWQLMWQKLAGAAGSGRSSKQAPGCSLFGGQQGRLLRADMLTPQGRLLPADMPGQVDLCGCCAQIIKGFMLQGGDFVKGDGALARGGLGVVGWSAASGWRGWGAATAAVWDSHHLLVAQLWQPVQLLGRVAHPGRGLRLGHRAYQPFMAPPFPGPRPACPHPCIPMPFHFSPPPNQLTPSLLPSRHPLPEHPCIPVSCDPHRPHPHRHPPHTLLISSPSSPP